MSFHNPHEFSINNSNFTSAKNATYNDNSTTYITQQNAKDPLKFLLKHSAIEATHESVAASYAPRCHPGTRKQVIGDIMAWATAQDDPLASKPIVWFSGPAGGGKTCVQREVAKRCQEQGILAASYFFSTRANLADEGPFVATMAHQLVSSVPGLRPYIVNEIQKDQAIFRKSLDLQFLHLISDPMAQLCDAQRRSSLSPYSVADVVLSQSQAHIQRRGKHIHLKRVFRFFQGSPKEQTSEIISDDSSESTPSVDYDHKAPNIVVVDGLDECRDRSQRVHLLRLIASAVAYHSLPLRFAICSRPEYDIRTEFDEDTLQRLTHRIRLEDYGADHDIQDYLIDSLFDIRKKHPSKHAIPGSWPSEPDVEVLVFKASGQFIYAATVIKFLDNHHRNPVEMLELVLNLSSKPTSTNPFAELDALYTTILDVPDSDLPLLKRLLHGLVAIKRNVDSAFLEELYCLDPGTVDIAFSDLHSIIYVPDPNESKGQCIRLHHKSLEDYLSSPHRSGRFFQSPVVTDRDVLEFCVLHLRSWDSGSPAFESRTLLYAANRWYDHAFSLCEDPTTLSSLVLTDIPAIAIKYEFIYSSAIRFPSESRDHIHQCLCTAGGSCVPFCARMGGLDRLQEEIRALHKEVVAEPLEVKLQRLQELAQLMGVLDDQQYLS